MTSTWNMAPGTSTRDIDPPCCEDCGEPLQGDTEIRMGVCRECQAACEEESEER